MKIGIAGPLGTGDLEHLLSGDTAHLPREMKGAPLLVPLIESLIAAGHEVAAFTTDPALEPRRGNRVIAHAHRLSVNYVPLRRHGFRPDRGARGRMLDLFALERKELAEAMRDESPDVVHAHWSYEYGAAALQSGLPALITCHDAPWAILKLKRDLYRLGRLLMARSVLGRARHLTAVSPYLAEELRPMVRRPIQVVPNPVPSSLIDSGGPRARADWQTRPPRIAMLINGWGARKNAEPAMRAMSRILEAYPGARMHLYGPDFGAGERAQGWAAGQALPEVFEYHGWTPNAEVLRALAGMDLLVHPALEESFGMTIAEAMTLGVPVVAGQSSGAVPWVLGGSDGGGLLVDVRSPDAIAEAVLRLLDDNTLYGRSSAQGRARAIEVFAPDAVARAYLACYQRVLADTGAMPAGVLAENVR